MLILDETKNAPVLYIVGKSVEAEDTTLAWLRAEAATAAATATAEPNSRHERCVRFVML